jgi:hypothetical protein
MKSLIGGEIQHGDWFPVYFRKTKKDSKHMKNNVVKWLVPVMAIVLLSGCSKSLQVGYDYDSSVNLRQFKTFRVEAERNVDQDPLLGSELNRRRLSDAVTQVMEAKGYKQDDRDPDIVVKYMTDVKDRQQIRSNNNYNPYLWWYGPMGNNYSTYNYQESRFILNIYQDQSSKMIWQGWATGNTKSSSKKEDRGEVMQNIIADILRSFPQATLDSYSRKK